MGSRLEEGLRVYAQRVGGFLVGKLKERYGERWVEAYAQALNEKRRENFLEDLRRGKPPEEAVDLVHFKDLLLGHKAVFQELLGRSVHSAATWADEVAAAFLMPEEAFREAWPQDLPPLEAAKEASERFKVSKRAALRRALGLGLISRGSFLEALKALKGREPPPSRGGGGDFWRTLEVQNSPTFTRELRRAAQEGEVDAKEVAHLLNVSLRTAWEFLTRGAE